MKEEILKDQRENFSRFEVQKSDFLQSVTNRMQKLDNLVQDFSHNTHERITKSLLAAEDN